MAPQKDQADFSDIIADADRRLKSWREKLEWISDLLDNTKHSPCFSPDAGHLAYLSIYMRFLGTGKTSLCEDGRHFRPSNHARIALQIEKSLSEIINPSNAFIIRKICPYLPSYDSAFMRAEPLTRIRDIAHRNDIPHDLKQEIKHTLQNKLHRCAGPEDLTTSEAILKRITSQGASYSHAFVEEFKVFHEELREFFNARSLDEHLEAIVRSGNKNAGLITKFLEAKNRVDNSALNMSAVLELLTELRSSLSEKSPIEATPESQRLRLTDIGLEDFAFSLLSTMLNDFYNTSVADTDWKLMLRVLTLTVSSLRLGLIRPDECSAIEHNLDVISNTFRPDDRDQLLILKAELDRCLRLALEYCDSVLALFPERVEKLGRKLGIEEHTIKFFSEADIRSNIAFQLSKLVTHLLKLVRTLADLPDWDALVTGKARGRFVLSENFSSFFDEDVILLLRKAEGDEEIPKGVVGVVLGHELPHLSHLGVRARQAGVVFTVCEDSERFAELEKLIGNPVVLEVTTDDARLEIAAAETGSLKRSESAAAVTIPEPDLEYECALCDLDKAEILNSGGKAHAARLLQNLSVNSAAGFKTPAGLVIPFGVMQESLRSSPEIADKYSDVASRLDRLSPPDFENRLEVLRDLIKKLKVPDKVLNSVIEKFGKDEKLMVRSSSNCEDLKEFAGAGLYDSVANVSPLNAADAILAVWSSIWTKRAAISRIQAGIPHAKAHMAVLIQQMITPDFSFIMHTVNPVNMEPDEVYVELAAGLGEVLASGAERGSPYRMTYNTKTGRLRMLSFTSFSHALLPDEKGGVSHNPMDYSKIKLSHDALFREELGHRLATIGKHVENSLGGPQDIEGAIVRNEIYLVQSRPQQGILKIEKQCPKIMALFQKRIEGDDALLELARLRFGQTGLGPEFYAETPDELEWLLGFRPYVEAPPVVHLGRGTDLLNINSLGLIEDFATRFAGRVFGMVIHDQPEISARFDDYLGAAKEIGRRLKKIESSPYLFIEYAVFLDPDLFIKFFRHARDAERISACIDIGHVGIKHIRDTYSEKHPGEDVCAINPFDPSLPGIIDDIQEATASALPPVINMIMELGKLKKPVHFHLHDGHPLSTFSPFGVSDHLSFFQEIPLPFEHSGKHSLPTMYGPSGLSEIVKTALNSLGPELVSFSLEIHPLEGREPLGDASNLFNHWTDKTNAEKMNSWLSVLLKNYRLLSDACSKQSLLP